MTVCERALNVLARARRPLTTMEITQRAYPNVSERRLQEIRPIIYAKLSSQLKWGTVRKSKGAGRDTYWELIR